MTLVRKSTRLRHITAPSLGELESLVERLPFKVEIKGAPMKQGSKWIVFFTVHDDVSEKFRSIDFE